MPLISVIIPVYNGEKTIQETIESVFNQSFTDFELIVINDGSQDKTLDILNQFHDPRLKIFTYPNAGQPASRNRGIACAEGDYISFIDADDLWTPDKLTAQYQALQTYPEAAVAYSWTDCINENGEFSRRGSYISATGNVYAKLLLIDFIENGSNPLIRKNALLKVGKFDESLSNAHDWDMWLRLAACYPFVAIPKAQILYRLSAHSMSTNVLGMEKSSLRVIDRCFQTAPASLQSLKSDCLANRYKGLLFKCIEALPNRATGLTAARFLGKTLEFDFKLMRSRVFLKLLFKIAIMILLPPKLAQIILKKTKTLTNTTTLLGYLKLDPD